MPVPDQATLGRGTTSFAESIRQLSAPYLTVGRTKCPQWSGHSHRNAPRPSKLASARKP